MTKGLFLFFLGNFVQLKLLWLDLIKYASDAEFKAEDVLPNFLKYVECASINSADKIINVVESFALSESEIKVSFLYRLLNLEYVFSFSATSPSKYQERRLWYLTFILFF